MPAKGMPSPADLVFGLLSAKNKPFSPQTAADHLQTEGIKKAVAQRALDSLVEKGKVTLKECGKTKLYYLRQDTTEKLDPDLLACTIAENDHTKKVLAGLKAESQQLRQRAAALRAGPTIAEIDERIKALDQEKREQEAKLERLKGSATVPKDKFVKVQANLVDYAAKWKKYRAMFMEVWGSVADGLPGVKNERDYLENTIGCDLDPKGATWKDFQAKHLPMGAANKRQRVR